MATIIPVNRLFEKVKDAIPNQQPTESENSNKNLTNCPHHFGYLANLPKNAHFQKNAFFAQELWNASFLHESLS